MMTRLFISLISAMLLGTMATAWAQLSPVRTGEAYPNRPIRLIVPSSPGGNMDAYARILARQVETQLGQPLVVDNRGGANGIVGYDIVAKAPGDGYTLLSTSFAFVVNPSIYKHLPYDTKNDFAPITNFALGLGYLLTVHPTLPVQSVKELIGLAKSKDTLLRYGSGGLGGGTHLAAAVFSKKAGIEMLHVPYKGGGPAINAALSGEVPITFSAVTVVVPFVKAGRLRALGFTGLSRVASMPDVPTIAEAGLTGFHFDSGWHGLFAPAKTPTSVITKLQAEVRRALEVPKLREYLIAGGYEPRGDSPADFQKIFISDIKLYADIVQAARIDTQ